MRIANATNGLAFPPYEAISMFLSTHGHHYSDGYFRIDAMPYSAVVELLKGGSLTIVDATRNGKALPDSFRFGVTTWCLVFNRAIGYRHQKVSVWQTQEMVHIAYNGKHKKLVQRIRRLALIFGQSQPAIIGRNILLEVHHGFIGDDHPSRIRQMVMEL